MDCATSNEATQVTRETAKATTAKTAVLVASTVTRCGLAEKVALIVPVEYSADSTRQPSTPMTSCPRNRPDRLREAGSKPRCYARGSRSQRATVPAAIAAPSPTQTTAMDRKALTVDRTDRSFVHSARMSHHACVPRA